MHYQYGSLPTQSQFALLIVMFISEILAHQESLFKDNNKINIMQTKTLCHDIWMEGITI
mgnify:CR=1 FL=1